MRIAFLHIGGVHQVLHTAPVAAVLTRDYLDAEVVPVVCDARSEQLVQRAAAAYGAEFADVRMLEMPRWGRWLTALPGVGSVPKLPLLWLNREMLAGFDAIVVGECTSTALRRMGVRHPKLICIPHGAGDRAVSFEERFRLFDRILVAGEKTARRMVEAGVATADRLATPGYVKLDLLSHMGAKAPRLFANDRPTVLYNPHFKRSLSSLDAARGIVARFAAQDRFNLVFAPHIRAFAEASAEERAAWEALAVPDRIIVDLGSDRLIDMSYTLAADIYLGDVSSQVYEFLVEPRPCVFVDAHGAAWRDNADYAFWQFGEVAAPDDVVSAVERAQARYGEYRAAQQQGIRTTFDGGTTGAAERAAADIQGYLTGAAPVGHPHVPTSNIADRVAG